MREDEAHWAADVVAPHAEGASLVRSGALPVRSVGASPVQEVTVRSRPAREDPDCGGAWCFVPN